MEIDVLAEALGGADTGGVDGQILVPFFAEGGRLTINDVHYVAEGDNKLVPAAQTPFANDAAFGFKHSNLRDYVQEKTGGRIRREDVVSISLEDLRGGGGDDGDVVEPPSERVRAKLSKLSNMQACIVNAVTLRDVQVFALGLLDSESRDNKRFLVRSAASFVQARIGLPKRPILDASVINSSGSSGKNHGGLIVVGSYVPKTTSQLGLLLKLDGLEKIEINVADLVDASRRADAIDAVLSRVEKAITSGKNTVVYTSRTLVTGNTPSESLAIGNAVSDGLVTIVSKLQSQPRFIIAKGGITSSDVATKGLGIKRAMVLGQAAPGVPVWSIGEEGKFPGMSYVVFPGNVGGDDELAKLVRRLSE